MALKLISRIRVQATSSAKEPKPETPKAISAAVAKRRRATGSRPGSGSRSRASVSVRSPLCARRFRAMAPPAEGAAHDPDHAVDRRGAGRGARHAQVRQQDEARGEGSHQRTEGVQRIEVRPRFTERAPAADEVLQDQRRLAPISVVGTSSAPPASPMRSA